MTPTGRTIALLADAGSIHTVRWAEGLASRGLDVHLLTLHAPLPGLSDGVRVHRLPGRAPAAYFLAAPSLRARLGRIRPSLLHAHYATGYGTLARLVRFRPLVLSAWGSDVLSFPQRSAWHRRHVTRNLAAADVVCATSEALAACVRSLCPGRAVSIVPFGVDLTRFVPREADPDPGLLTVGTVKGLDAKYGIDRLLRAVAAARHRLAGSPHLAVRVLGEGPARSELETLARELGLTDVAFPGAVPHADVPGELARLDVFLALSRVEGFGVAVAEAAAAGLPSIVSDAGGLPEIVRDGETGFVIPDGDAARASEALVRLATDPALRRAMGKAARADAEARYSWNGSLEAMLRVYAGIPGREDA